MTKYEEYILKIGCSWHVNATEKPKWTKLVLSRIDIPRHSFIAWVLMKQKLLRRSKLAKYPNIQAIRQQCNEEEQT